MPPPPERFGCPGCGACAERQTTELLRGPFAVQTVITLHTAIADGFQVPATIANLALAPGLVRQVVLGVPEQEVSPGDRFEMRNTADGPRFFPAIRVAE